MFAKNVARKNWRKGKGSRRTKKKKKKEEKKKKKKKIKNINKRRIKCVTVSLLIDYMIV